MINRFRVLLIELGKILPFIICAIVLVSYSESMYALYNENYIKFPDGLYLYKPLSWFVARCFEYELPTLTVLVIISIAIRTCIYNKLACLYLGINLVEKSYFQTIELYPEYIYTICIINICTCVWLCWNGLRRILRPPNAIS